MRGRSSSWVAPVPVKTDRKNILRVKTDLNQKEVQEPEKLGMNEEENKMIGLFGIVDPEKEYKDYYL